MFYLYITVFAFSRFIIIIFYFDFGVKCDSKFLAFLMSVNYYNKQCFILLFLIYQDK